MAGSEKADNQEDRERGKHHWSEEGRPVEHQKGTENEDLAKSPPFWTVKAPAEPHWTIDIRRRMVGRVAFQVMSVQMTPLVGWFQSATGILGPGDHARQLYQSNRPACVAL